MKKQWFSRKKVLFGKMCYEIIVNEEREKNEATYEDIIHYLWQNDVPGENHKMIHQKMFSFSVNEPILIECLTPESRLNEVLDKTKGIITEGTICTIPVRVYIDK